MRQILAYLTPLNSV